MKKRKDIAKESWFVRQFKDKTTTVSAIVLGVVIILGHQLTNAVNVCWVKPIASRVRSSVGADFVLLLCFLWIFVYYGLKNRKSYLPNWRLVTLSLILTIFYAIIRFNKSPVWIFLETKTVPCIKYMDIILFTGLVSIILIIRFVWKALQKRPKEIDNFFFNDVALLESEGQKIKDLDKYKFYSYAENIGKGINTSIFENAFAIGITAKWGAGKTSFVNMIKSQIDKEATIIEFNPWRSASPNAIIKDFFETLRGHLNADGTHINEQIFKYAQKIIELNDSNLSKGVGILLSLLSSDSSLKQMFDKINSTLKRINKKLVIIIDDVDRLTDEEVLEIIRLIRNTANFYNTFFIVAYDKSYVLKCLEGKNINDYESFLEKIFQLEITLPPFDKEILITKLLDNLRGVVSKKERLERVYDVFKTDSIIRNQLFVWLKTFRDVTLLSNSIKININIKEKDVDLIDCIFIELLRVKYPSVYVAFFENYQDFFNKGEGLYAGTTGSYMLRYKDDGSGSYLFHYLNDNKDILNISDSAIRRICKLMVLLFQGEDKNGLNFRIMSHEDVKLSIANSDQFPLYYSYQIPTGFLQESLFLETIGLPLPEIKNRYKEWADARMDFELGIKIRGLDIERNINNQNIFENFTTSLFYLANYTASHSDNFHGVRFEPMWLVKLLSYGQEFYSERLQDYNQFIESLFAVEDTSIYYQAVFLKQFLKSTYFQNEQRLFMDEPTAIKHLVSYLKSICKTEEKLNQKVWFFYECCNIPPETEGTNKYAYIPDANKIFINFISTKDLTSFLSSNIAISTDDSPKYQNKLNAVRVFGSNDKFEEFLKEQEKRDERECKALVEYRKFYDKAKAAGSTYIDFDFKYINIKNRIFHV